MRIVIVRVTTVENAVQLAATPAAGANGGYTPGFTLLSAIGVLCFVAVARRVGKD